MRDVHLGKCTSASSSWCSVARMRCPLILLVVAACTGDSHLAIEAHCNPLGFGSHCAVPWPSSAFEVADASTPIGRRVAIPDTLPKNVDGKQIRSDDVEPRRRLSPAAPMLVAFRAACRPPAAVTRHLARSPRTARPWCST
jgi:hypothetical protein